MPRPKTSSACPGFGASTLSRRALLRVGGAGLWGLTLQGILEAADRTPARKARAKSIIFLHQFGGPSQTDTFDMKPQAPEAIRGEFKPIPTRVPGLVVSERLPRLATVMDKVTVIRSMRHTMKNHNSAAYYSLTGHAPPLDDIRLRDTRDLYPSYGSVVERLAPARPGVPSFVAYPHVLRDGSVTPGQHASFLGKAYDPLLITEDPNDANFRLPELSLPEGLTPERMENRREFQRLIDQQAELLDTSTRARGIEAAYDKAVAMLTSPQVRQAFNLAGEPESVRTRYGRTTYGQGCLLARRLVEAGVRFVNVYFASSIGGRRNSGGWDTHGFDSNPMYPILKDYLLPITDQTLPALLTDLEERGLLDTTLVVWMGEFGRSPRINKMEGRDHWPQCYTAILAGGGVPRGAVYGASERNGAYPAHDPVSPDDLAATMFSLLGLDPKTEVLDALNRPLPISAGQVIPGLLA